MEFDNGRASSSGHGKANSNASDDKGDGDANVEANYNASDAEGDSDANTEDQHGNDIVEEQEREVQPSQPPGRCQRKRKVAKWPSDKIVVTELTEDGMPTEDKAQKRMRKLAGLIARQRLSLMLPSFNYLTEEEKEELYVDSVQQWLEFADDVKDTAWKMMMRIINKSWRTHKSSLVTNFVRKGLNARTKHPYIGRREWADFVELHNSEEAKEKSETYKKLRERNKQNHCLGTTGYAGKAEKWKQEDSELAAKGISNPWHKFPEGRPRSYLRGRGKLVISEFSAEIHWSSKSAESISQKILEKQAELDSSGVTAVRDKDVLTQVLGQPEQTGRMRGVSSYSGWKHWPNCTSMYRKRKHSDIDVEAIKVEVANYIFDMLREHGVKLDLPSNTPPFVVGLKSSCASVPDEVPYASACNNVQLDRVGGTSYPNLVDLITEPKLCTLVINPGDNQVEVGKGTVFPPQAKLYSVPVLDKNAVVLVSFINPGHEGIMLTPPTGDVTTFGQAMFKRVQWRKDGIVITDQVPTKSSLGPTLLGRSANHSLNDLVSNVSSSQVYKVKSAPAVGNCASKEHAEDKKQTNESTRSSIPPRAPTKSNIKRDQQVGVNQQQEEEEAKPTKLSKITPVASLWVRPNSMFNFGQPILSVEEVEKAGPWCAALHAHYMKACAENRNTGIVGTMDRQYFLREVRYEPLTVGFEDLFDLLRLDALDVALLRVMTLCLIVEARDNSVPVALLDPDALSIITLNSKRSYSVAYLERCLKKYAQKKYVMFAHNCGGHWIVVIIVPNWQKVLYLDSNRGMKTDLRGLKSVIDEAYGNIQPKAKKEQTKVKLSHATKIPCLQQGLDNTCGFFVAHNLMRAMAQANLDNSEDFDFLSVPISLGDIREKISMFIMSQIVEEEGEFYDPGSCK